jgi:hypothetical protein
MSFHLNRPSQTSVAGVSSHTGDIEHSPAGPVPGAGGRRTAGRAYRGLIVLIALVIGSAPVRADDEPTSIEEVEARIAELAEKPDQTAEDIDEMVRLGQLYNKLIEEAEGTFHRSNPRSPPRSRRRSPGRRRPSGGARSGTRPGAAHRRLRGPGRGDLRPNAPVRAGASDLPPPPVPRSRRTRPASRAPRSTSRSTNSPNNCSSRSISASTNSASRTAPMRN